MQTLKEVFTVLVIALFLTGCAMTGNVPVDPVPREATVAIRVEVAKELESVVSTGDFVMEAAGTGVAGGVLVGTVAGLACGPFVFVCAPMAGAIGGAAGLVVGGIYGSAVSIKRDERAALNEILATSFGTKAPYQYLEQAVRDQASDRWTINDEGAEYIVTVRLDEFYITQNKANSYSIFLTGSFTSVDSTEPLEKEPPRYSFQHLTPERRLEFLLGREGENLRNEFERGIEQLASEMLTTL